MKRKQQIPYSGILSIATLAVTLSLAACHPTQDKEKQENQTSNIELENISWEERPATAEGCKISASYPIGEDNALNNSIREWMNERLGGTYSGDLKDGKNMLAFYGKAKADEFKSNMLAYGDDSAMAQSVYYVQLKKVFETGLFVSYTSEIYTYAGGAHGGESLTGGMFRKSDGRNFGWDMFTFEGKEKLRNMIKEGLKKQYFKVQSDEEFYDMLFPENARYSFPLPETAPICRFNGMQFVYQQYEIAPYSAGMPSYTVPYDSLKSLVTATVRPLLESTTDSIARNTNHLGIPKG